MAWDDKDREGQGGSIEYNFSITESKAGFTEYNNGNTALLILEGEKEFDNGKVLDDHLWIGASDKWTVSDDGAFFVNVDGDDDARFDKRSKMQQFIASAIAAGVPLQERGESSLDARAWAGLKLRIREEERSFTPRDAKPGEGPRTFQQPLVIEYLGEAGASSAKVTKASTNGSGGDDEVTVKARAIAAEEDDLISYITKVTKELGVELDHAVCQQSFYEGARK